MYFIYTYILIIVYAYLTGKHLTHMAKMGIGWKPCVNIKSSRDNISDRFIDVSKCK